jgi:acyl-CoA synthetase (NDP forming)
VTTRPHPDRASVRALFEPRSVALVGASEKSSWTTNIVANLTEFGYDGKLFVVKPRGGTVLGHQAYRSLTEIGEPVDVVYVMVPTDAVEAVLLEGAALGIRSFVVLSAGFGEAGGEGVERERRLQAIAREHSLCILGPNGVGYINAALHTAPYGLPIPKPLVTGGVGVVLQSGALATAFNYFAHGHNVGLSLLTSVGNEAVMTVTDVVEHLVDDPSTKVIALFLETVRDPERFRQAALRAAAAGKPIVALKIGSSELAARAAAAHTGALVGDDQVTDAAFRSLGITRVRSMEDLLYTSYLLAELGPARGDRLAVITPSGGASEIIADRAAEEGLELPPFSEDVAAKLRALLPDFATVQNPLDLTGYISVDLSLAAKAHEIVVAGGGYDQILYLNTFPKGDAGPAWEESETLLEPLAESMHQADIPTVICGSVIGDTSEYGRSVQDRLGITYVAGLDHVMTALGAQLRATRRIAAAGRGSADVVAEPAVRGARIGLWAEHHAARLLRENGIPVVPGELAVSEDDAVEAAERFGFPVVVKAAVDGLGHKSDVGGVKLGLADSGSVRKAFGEVGESLRAAGHDAPGVLVQPQRDPGVELIVGVVRDPTWGPTMVLGLGGIWVELLGDVQHLVLPADESAVREALTRLRGYRLLTGARGTEPADLDEVARVIAAIGRLAVGLGPDLESLEVNPLSVAGDRVEALDALVTWTSGKEGEA